MLRPAHLRLGTPSRNSPALVGAGAGQNARRPAALLLRAQAAPAPGERRTAASAAPPAAPPAPAQAPPPAEATFATADETVQIKPQTAADGSRFVWTRNWYPLTALDYLDPSRPAQLKVLGYDLVVWRDGSGTWRAFRDACPHRAAPLSEGRIDPVTKNLECAYHGWQFGGGGAPQEIPQSDPGLPKQTACASGRGCAQAFPTAEAHGLVWAWLEPGPAGEAAAAKAPLPTLPAADHRGVEWFHVSTWYVRDLEVDFLPLLENSCDPGHVHFTHAGYIGSRDKAGPMNVRLLEQDEEGVYRFVTESPDGGPVEGFKNLVLKPPCMLWGSSEGMSEDGELALLYFVVPVAPGKSRLMSLLLATNKKFRFLAKVFHWQPWLRHLYNRTVAAQDIAVLHRQGTNMASPEWPGWRKGFYLPTRSDAGVVVLRKWLDTVAGGGIAWGPNIRPGGAPIQAETRRELLFDHYHQHTEHCPHCRAALARVRSGAAGAAVAAGAAFLTLCAAWGRGAAPLSPASLALLCVLGAALAARSALEKLKQQFIFSDWRHADH